MTICTHDRQCMFGEIIDGKTQLNPFGEIIANEWLKTSEIRPNVELDEFTIMPNHVHGIVLIIDDCRGVSRYAPTVFRSPSNNLGAMSAVLNRRPQNESTKCAKPFLRRYGSAIITNTSSVMNMISTAFANISCITLCDGNSTAIIPTAIRIKLKKNSGKILNDNGRGAARCAPTRKKGDL